jgi:hypothetical protein
VLYYILAALLVIAFAGVVYDIRRINRKVKCCHRTCGPRKVCQNDIETETMLEPVSQDDIDTRIIE